MSKHSGFSFRGPRSGEPIPPTPDPPVILTESPLPNLRQNRPASIQLEATSELSPLTYEVFAGDLPSGTTLDPDTGLLSGTPDTLEEFDFTLRVTDPLDQHTDKQLTGEVIEPPPDPVWLTPADPISFFKGDIIGFQFEATTEYPDLTYTLHAGTLPDGLELTAAGLLTGTLDDAGDFPVTIRVTNGINLHADLELTVSAVQLQTLSTFEIDNVGYGFTLDNELTFVDGTARVPAVLQVTEIGGNGQVLALTCTNPGIFEVIPGGPTSILDLTGGTGLWCSVTTTFSPIP